MAKQKQGRVLVLGAGSAKDQRIFLHRADEPLESPEEQGRRKDFEETFDEVVRLDIKASHNPDILWDLNQFPWPIPDESFNQVHAYEVLEHLGRMGDFAGFFALWREIWRVLKPNGWVCATVPWWDGVWAWSDPGHTRVYNRELLTYLSQEEHVKQIGCTSMTDYRESFPPPFTFFLRWDNVEQRATDPGYNFILQRGWYDSSH
jgi:SAM-dependent methyltransferase